MNGLKWHCIWALALLSLPTHAADPRQFGLVADDTSRSSLRFRQQSIESPRGPREIEIVDKNSVSLRQAQYFDLAGQLAYVAVQLPYVTVDQSFTNSRRKPAEADGVGDVMLGFGVGLYRRPALDRNALKNYDRNGLSSACGLQVNIPTAAYQKNQSVNVSANRWMVLPECQLAWTMNQWVFEGLAGLSWFGDNADYKIGRFEQKNVYHFKTMASFSVIPQMWLAATLEYQTGGMVTRGGQTDHDRIDNWLAGAAMNISLPGRNSVRIVGEWPISTAQGSSKEREISLVLSHVW
ncbi:transporter [Deefgea salmonis]|uniref:Transporter n=1 Tax=Deefgea salmonis TaxID=2875502 RepID=A0ABS8BKK5_9NEIS|nr:transporter [Deefgea salmonis]MCB5196132.1 transporter [Deefgea salmonis]